jgi:hypothetical protein
LGRVVQKARFKICCGKEDKEMGFTNGQEMGHYNWGGGDWKTFFIHTGRRGTREGKEKWGKILDKKGGV